MNKKYTPELGQMAFGCPSSEFSCPDFIQAGLQMLAEEIERVEWNIQQKEFPAPTRNCATQYETDVFKMSAYYWGEDEIICNRPNFSCDGFEVRWYKYLGRGMSMNQEIDANKFFILIDKCIRSVRKRDKKLYE